MLLLTRNELIDALNEIIVVPATRTIRGLETEVLLSPAASLPPSGGDELSLTLRHGVPAARQDSSSASP